MAMRDNMIIKFGIALLSLAALFLLIRSNSRPNSRAGLQPQPPYGVVEVKIFKMQAGVTIS